MRTCYFSSAKKEKSQLSSEKNPGCEYQYEVMDWRRIYIRLSSYGDVRNQRTQEGAEPQTEG